MPALDGSALTNLPTQTVVSADGGNLIAVGGDGGAFINSFSGDNISTFTTPTDGDQLTWDNANSRWDATAPASPLTSGNGVTINTNNIDLGGTLSADATINTVSGNLIVNGAGQFTSDAFTTNLTSSTINLGDALADNINVIGQMVFDGGVNDIRLTVANQTNATPILRVPDLPSSDETIALVSQVGLNLPFNTTESNAADLFALTQQDAASSAGRFAIDNTTSVGAALVVETNSDNAASLALGVKHDGASGDAGSFSISTGSGTAVYAESDGTGTAISAYKGVSSSGTAMNISHDGTAGTALQINMGSSNGSPVLDIINNGTGTNIRAGLSGEFQVGNAGNVTTPRLDITNTATQDAVSISNTTDGRGLAIVNTTDNAAGRFELVTNDVNVPILDLFHNGGVGGPSLSASTGIIIGNLENDLQTIGGSGGAIRFTGSTFEGNIDGSVGGWVDLASGADLTAIATNISFVQGANRTFGIEDGTTNGNSLSISAGLGLSGNGGNLDLFGGGSASGNGGNVSITSGAGPGSGGNISLAASDGNTGGSTGGTVNINSGNGPGAGGNGGNLNLTAGSTSSSGGDTPGDVTITAGTGAGSSPGGNINLVPGIGNAGASNGIINILGTSAARLTVGTTGQRPASPQNGMIRYNSTLTTFEGYNGAWVDLTGGGSLVVPHFGDANTLVIGSATPPEPLFGGTDYQLGVASPGGGKAFLSSHAYGGIPEVRLSRTNGTKGGESSVIANDIIGEVAFTGREAGNGYPVTSSITAIATDNYDGGGNALGTALTFIGTPTGSNVPGEIMRLQDGYVGINNNAPGVELDVNGDANVSGDLTINGTNITLSSTGGITATGQINANPSSVTAGFYQVSGTTFINGTRDINANSGDFTNAVQATSFVLSTPVTKFYGITPAEFQLTRESPANDNELSFTNNGVLVSVSSAVEQIGAQIVAPVHLPHQAEIVSITVFGNNNTGIDMDIRFVEKSYSTAATDVGSVIIPNGTPGITGFPIGSVNGYVINNQSDNYMILIDIPTSAGSSATISGVRVEYLIGTAE